MPKTVRSVKTFRRTWDSDKALRSTHRGYFDKYQLRAYLFIVLGYAVIVAWLTAMPIFARKFDLATNSCLFQSHPFDLVLPPKDLDCTPIYPSNQSNETTTAEPIYRYSDEYGRSVLTDVRTSFVRSSDARNVSFSSTNCATKPR